MRKIAQFDLQFLNYLSWNADVHSNRPFLVSLSEADWQRYLHTLDNAGMIFHFLSRLKETGDFDPLPVYIQERLKRNLHDQMKRREAISEEFIGFNRLLQEKGIRYLCLKGLTSYPGFVDGLAHRVQYDHDFLVHKDDLQRAHDLFLGLGFESLDYHTKLNIDHLPTLVKKNGWQWRGNLYDPNIPRAVELHFRLWDNGSEGIVVRSLNEAWQNSVTREFDGVHIPVLGRQDALTYAVLHAFRHLLKNDLRLSHLYELAFFLNRNSANRSFWNSLIEKLQNCESSLKVYATMFELARTCFAPEISPETDLLIQRHLSPTAQLWIRNFGLKEALESYRQSKSGMFLQMDFMNSRRKARSHVLKRLLPLCLPLKSWGVQIRDDQKTFLQSFRERCCFLGQLLSRSVFHGRSLLVFMWRFPLWRLSLANTKLQKSASIDSSRGH